jgi:phosphatidylglycerol lysyltransferase
VAAPTIDDGAHLGLERWTSPSGAGRIFYGDVKGYRIAVGAPRGSLQRLRIFFFEFEEACRRVGRRPLYFALSAPAIEALDPEGARGRWHAGDVPIFGLERWLDPALIPSGIRAQVRRARNQGVTVRRLSAAPGPADPAGPALHTCLRTWLVDKSLPPMGFVTTPYLFEPWPEHGVFIAELESRVVGFLVPSLALFPDLWRVDAIGRSPDAPNGCSELLISEAFRYAAEQCYASATLGLAPLAQRSGADSSRPSHWMDKVAEAVREIRMPGYSFAGLESFKAKFTPDEWRPVYCVSGGGRLSLRDMTAMARVFAGGSLAGYMLRSILWLLGRRRLLKQET